MSRNPKAKGKSRSQPHPEPLRKEIRGIIFLLVAFALGVSLFSYAPKDQLLWETPDYMGKAYNLFGTVGAFLADKMFRLLGFSSYWLVLIFLILAILSFKGRSPSSPVRSLIATLFLLLSFAGILHLQWPEPVLYKGEKFLGGGLLGLYISGFLKGFLNYFGAYALLMVIFVISLMLSARISLGRVLSITSGWFGRAKRRAWEWSTKRRERKRKRRVRVEVLGREKKRPKRSVQIVEPKKESLKIPEQDRFPFMHVAGEFKLPPLDLLKDPPEVRDAQIQRESLEMTARRLERKLEDFGVEGEVVEILPGPVITMYEFKPAPGVKISKVANLSDDLALALRAPSIRIVAPIPGKAAIGLEIPNNQRAPVYLKEIISSQAYKNSNHRLTIALGKDITGMPVVADLAKMPHLLVAGATGAGKSVFLNAMINSLLFKVSPEMVRFLIIDPKRIELSLYKDIPHLLHPVVTQPKEATKALRWAVEEMERRYMLLSDRGVRNIEAYNRKILKDQKTGVESGSGGTPKGLPYIVLVIDELADLMMSSSREVEEAITRLAQMARAAGIHLIIATQRPSVDVLTGIIKANFPTRMSFQVSSKVDSRTILDTMGAESLLGEGDSLFMPPGVGQLRRIHGAYISEEEVKAVTDFLRAQMKPDYDHTMLAEVAREEEKEEDDIELDEKYDSAINLVIQTGHASISMLQRKLRVGYNRAARMIEAMERQGIVGPSDGVKPRAVLGKRGG